MADNNDIMPNGVSKDGKTFVKYLGDRNAKEFTVPEGVTHIGDEAFKGCKNLTSIRLPFSLTSIGDDAFRHCLKLKSVTLPFRLTSIGNGAFQECQSFEAIIVPEGVEIIRPRTFLNCLKLKSITLPSSLKEIRGGAFRGCKALKTIKIPENLEKIGNNAFDGCRALETFVVDKNNLKFTSINGVLFTKNRKTIFRYPEGKKKKKNEYSIPKDVVNIGSGAFSGCSSLKLIRLPDGVTVIGDSAFKGCSSLKSINIPNGLTEIIDHAFSGCSSLTSVEIPDSVGYIGFNVFSHCTSLKTICLSNKLTCIGEALFLGCSSLAYVILPTSVKEIKSQAFSECKSLNLIVLSSNLCDIADDAFDDCPVLEEICVMPGNAKYCSIDGVLLNSDRTVLIRVPEGRKEKEYHVPHTVREIGEYAFQNCMYLETVVLPSEIENVWKHSFSDASSLKSITVLEDGSFFFSLDGVLFTWRQDGKIFLVKWPEGKEERTYIIPHFVAGVLPSAFKKSKYLRSVVIPKNVTEIESKTLQGLTVYAPAGSKVEELVDSLKNLFHRI